jgi:hypothetical protein
MNGAESADAVLPAAPVGEAGRAVLSTSALAAFAATFSVSLYC